MQKLIRYYCFLLLLACAGNTKSLAQSIDYNTSKEKIYLQTSHVFFKPGEQLYYKIYLVNAQNQKPSKQSSVVYVEIINPAGNVIRKQNYKIENGYAEGSFDFVPGAVGGIYKLRAYTTWMKNETENTFFTKEITLQKIIAPRVLMKLDFPKKGYGPGDEVSADYAVRSLDDRPIRNYEIKFTVSVAGKTIGTSKATTDHEGKTKIIFRLPNDLASNDGLLNVTISYDSYTESISRSIPIVLQKIDLQMMPEGGTLVNELPTNMAFKAVNDHGKAADIKGEVIDDLGNKVASFESYHFGMGRFAFTPRRGRTYTARITSPINITQTYKLPLASAAGVIMNISKEDNHVQVKLVSNMESSITIVGQTKNIDYYRKKIDLKIGEQTIKIDASLFPAGIARFTLYNMGNLPVAERICFLNQDKILRVKITTDKERYVPREKVTMKLQTFDETGNPVPANLSLAVMDDKLWSLADDKQDHILSWLLMSSELKGKVEEPQFYFRKDEAKAVPALDLVMLTHGYRYFEYIEYVEKEKRVKYTQDEDNIVSGIVLDKDSVPVKANVYLMNVYEGGKAMYMTTGDDGVFFFSELQPYQNYYVVARSIAKKEKVTIKILQNGIGYNPLRVAQYKQVTTVRELVGLGPVVPEKEMAENQALAKEISFGAFPNTSLNEVVVTGYGTMRKSNLTGSVATVSAAQLIQANDIVTALEGKVNGIQVFNKTNPGDNAMLKIRGGSTISGAGEPLIIVNNVPVSKLDWNITPGDISSITVLKDAAAASIWGARAAHGVIVITTKSATTDRIRVDMTKKYYYTTQLVQPTTMTYTVARRFYMPQFYSLQASERNDFRETIYWNPVIQTDKNGLATISFFNSDASTTFRAIAEGIGYNGKVGRTEFTYAAQSPMSVDAKIPPYLTIGDKVTIPVVIKNNYDQKISATVSITLPDGMTVAGDYKNEITIEKGKSLQVLVPLQVTKAVNGRIGFTITSPIGSETIALPIVAADKGFPVVETISGNKSGKHDFRVGRAVPNSLKTKLTLFRTLEGQLLDGIESMLREPYGCFEQTSSTTYPNIYVLKYLRQSGKSNPDIERKAMGYLERGYQRLVGFETRAGGFEWFGNTPPHEALTAYGLLEFTDMQEFINVDKQMLQRTKAYLLSRRDGKGEFTLANGGYDRFASVPNKIANIYIVYALTQAGIGNEIRAEYETAVRKALESNDAYMMAMMALAAHNMKDFNNYSQLMSKLDESYQRSNLSAETSVVNSRDASLKVEAMSLYTLALAREQNPRVGLMAELISKVLAQKTYYGYGSTQSTVMALNAVVQYSKIIGEITKDVQVNFRLNDQHVIPTGTAGLESVTREGENSLNIQFSNEGKTLPYNLEVSYYTFTPPNSDKAELKLSTKLAEKKTRVGETVRMEIEVKNDRSILQPMAIVKVGIPAGLSQQPWQLKEIMDKKQVAYYEIFDNYLVFYWMGFAPNETKKISLDLKAEVPGTYTGKAGTTYLYYTPEHKHWNEGLQIEVLP